MADPARRLAPVVRLAPAKLNLTLAIVGRRPDGYHDLHSVVVLLELADRLSLAVAPHATEDTLHVTGPDAGPNGDNLVLRAIARIRRAAAPLAGGPAALPMLAVRLEKRIPVAAGLGGGSSDAAAAIDGALEAWDVALPAADRLAAAAEIGSDVPLFLAPAPGRAAAVLLEGRGERVTVLAGPAGPPPGVLLVTPGLVVRTPDAFALFDAGGVAAGSTRLASAHLAQELAGGLRSADLVARAGVLASANDLAAPAATLHPALVPFRRALMRRLARPVGQSGSGPTLWALYPSRGEAEAAANDLRLALDRGEVAAPGERPPTIVATTLITMSASTGETPP